MAELSVAETTADPCCAPKLQASCCEPRAKAECCGHDEGCGCAAGSEPTQPTGVRERYAVAAVRVTSTDPGAGCCAPTIPDEIVAMLDAVPDLRPTIAPATEAELHDHARAIRRLASSQR